jgi:hypothetical protein
MKTILKLLSLALLLSSCEKVVDLNLDNGESTLVVEANITNLPAPYTVQLSKTVPFDNSSIYPPVTNALVIISDNTGVVDTLTNQGNGKYITNTLQGVVGRTYSLKINSEGKEYTATSKMPQLVVLDSLRRTEIVFGGTTNKTVVPVYTDPTSLGNNYNFILFVNGQKFKKYFVVNDNTNNGGVSQRPILDGDLEMKTGDIATIEMQTIAPDVYDYFFTLMQMGSDGPGGGTTPTNPPTNIKGGAFGIFSAHTVQTKQTIIQ